MGVEERREIAKDDLDHEPELGSRKCAEEVLENVVHRSSLKGVCTPSTAKRDDWEPMRES